MPLADVLRIEQIPLSRIEYIGYRPVLNFEGQLLPVEDSGGILAAAQGDPEAQIVVVVCREGNRHVGIAVSHVLDVAAGGDLFEAGTEPAHRRRHAAQGSRDRRRRSGRRAAAAGQAKARHETWNQPRRHWHESTAATVAHRKQKAAALRRGLLGARWRDAVRRAHHAHS